MAELTTKTRKALPGRAFAVDGKRRKYPIHDAAHGRNALARVSQFGTSAEKAKVRAAVRRRFPKIGDGNTHKGGLNTTLRRIAKRRARR